MGATGKVYRQRGSKGFGKPSGEGMGRKDRLLPLGERALHWVQEYLDRSRPLLAWNQQDATLFLGQEGMALSPTWLSTHAASYVKRAEPGKHGGCHPL